MSPAPEPGQPKDGQTHHLCEDCYDILDRLDLLMERRAEGFEVDKRLYEFKSLDEARASSEAGCKICTYLIAVLPEDPEGLDGGTMLNSELVCSDEPTSVGLTFGYRRKARENEVGDYSGTSAYLGFQSRTGE